MLANAHRNKFGEWGWAALTGFLASLPPSVRSIHDSYFSDAPIALGIFQVVEIVISATFLGLLIAALVNMKEKTASDLLNEILARR